MPQARKPAPRSSRTSTAFKEPAALKQLNKSLDAAQDALADLRKHAGRDVSQGARDLYKDVRTFVSSAPRDTGKLTKALARDFEQAEKQLARRRPVAGSRMRPAASRSRTPRTTTKRSTGKAS
jgi:hypothetical protein